MPELAHSDESLVKESSAAPTFAETLPSIAAPGLPVARGGLTAESVLALQRTAGNQGVARMLSHSGMPASPPRGVAGVGRADLDEMLARSVSRRLDRCPNGSCAGACTCEEDDETVRERPAESDAAVKARQLRAKAVGDAEEDRPDAPGGAPVDVVIELVPEDADAGEQEGAEATAGAADVGARQKRRANAPAEVSVAQVQGGPVRSGLDVAIRSKAATSVAGGAAATHPLGGAYGLTFEESIVPTIGAKKVGSAWHPAVTSLLGNFSQQVSLLAGQSEVTGPGGNTLKANFCKQVQGLKTLGNTVGNPWYMLRAVKDHEDVHAAHFGPGLKAAEPTITAALEAVSIPDAPGMTQIAAATALAANAAFKAAVTAALQTWIAQDSILLAGDHAAGGPCDIAEHKVVDPMITSICAHAKKEAWGACADCPP